MQPSARGLVVGSRTTPIRRVQTSSSTIRTGFLASHCRTLNFCVSRGLYRGRMSEERIIRLCHVRRRFSNAGSYLDARTGRSSPRFPCPGARRRFALRADRRTASFGPQQVEEFEMDTRGLPTDAGGDAVETAQMRRPEWQLRQRTDVVQLRFKSRHQSELVRCRQNCAVDLQRCRFEADFRLRANDSAECDAKPVGVASTGPA